MTQELPPTIVTIREASLSTFAAGMAKLEKTATKLDVPPMTYEVIGRETQTKSYELPNGTRETFEEEWLTIAVHGESPRLPGGWHFLGAIEHLEGGNLLHGDDAALSAYRTAAADCQHCGFKRNRRKTVVLRSEDGTLTQVGSACLKDFLGYHGNPERLAWLADAALDAVLAEVDEEAMSGGFGGELATPTDVFLAAVSATVRVHGWVPKSAYRGTPTAELVRYVLGLSRPYGDDHELRAMIDAVTVTDEDRAEAQAVKDWSNSIPADTDNNYLGNVRVSLAGSYVLARHFGIAASAVSARRKTEETAKAREIAEGKRAASAFVGTVGARETFTVTVLFVRSFETDYGTKYLVEMEDENGNVLKTFSTGDFGYRAERGDSYTIKGTVKSHETYNGNHSTMLTRVAIV